MKWRTSTRPATGAERNALEYVRKKAERLHLEAVCGALCAAHPLGMADCAHVRAFARIGRWSRVNKKLCVEIRATSNVPGGDQTFRWRFCPVRACSESYAKVDQTGT